MKQLNYFLIVLLLVSLAACKGDPKKKVMGTWQVESVEGEKLSDAEKNMKFSFKEGGVMEMSSGDKTMTGKWDLDKDGKTFSVTPEGAKEAMKWTLNSADAKQLVITDEKSKKVTFKKN